MSEKRNVVRERNFSGHHMLLGAARMALEEAEKKKPERFFYAELVTMTMSALALEALCNAIGERVISNWGRFERKPTVKKLRKICKKLTIDFDVKEEPWSTVEWLREFRNEVAHAKPVPLKEIYDWTEEEFERNRMEGPKSPLEQMITLDNARRAYDRVNEIMDLLCMSIVPEDRFGLYSDSWTGDESVAKDD